jgi:hypothetical protein
MKKIIVFIIFLLAITGCTHESTGESAVVEDTSTRQKAAMVLEDMGEAPELKNEIWLNTEHPLRLADLRGKVVLLDMWTFG